VPHLRKGALLAQNPGKFETIPELDEADREVIRRETTRKFNASYSLRPAADATFVQISGVNLETYT
jgi:hypothetical protein